MIIVSRKSPVRVIAIIAILSISLLILPELPVYASIQLDGSVGTDCAITVPCSTLTASLTTSLSPDVIIVDCGTSDGSKATPTSSHLTFTQRYSNFEGDNIFYAIASGTLSAEVITCTDAASINTMSMIAYGVSGANTGSPFDPNGGLPAHTNNCGSCSGSTLSVTYSTSNAHDFIMLNGVANYCGGGAMSGSYTTIKNQHNAGSGGIGMDLLANYQIVSTTQSGATATLNTTCNVFIAIEVDAIQEAISSVTLPIKCTMSNSASAVTLTISGGSPSPTTVSCDGASHNITVNPSVSITVTEPADGSNTRSRFNPSGTLVTTLSITSCASGTCSTWTFHNYYQLQNTYQATPHSPTTWDDIYSIAIRGNVGGNITTATTLTTTNGGGAVSSSAWLDYNVLVSLTTPIVGNSQWNAVAPSSFTQTTGGNTNNVNYNKASGVSQLSSDYNSTSWELAIFIIILMSVVGYFTFRPEQ